MATRLGVTELMSCLLPDITMRTAKKGGSPIFGPVLEATTVRFGLISPVFFFVFFLTSSAIIGGAFIL